MTGNDHNHDALVAALRQPALPTEQVDEAAAVAAMIEAQTRLPAASTRPRSRRGVAIAAVTVASLGLGGLAAAGPGIFSPAADRPDTPATTPTPVSTTSVDDEGEARVDVAPTSTPAHDSRDRTDTGDCEGPDGATTSTVEGHNTSDCDSNVGDDNAGGATQIDVDDPADGDDRPGNSGNAPGHTDRTPGKSDVDPPGQSGSTPGQSGSTPGQSGDTPGQSGNTPGQSGNTPGQSGDTPGQSGNTPGQSGDTPGQSGNTPGQSGNTPAPPPVSPSGQAGNAPERPDKKDKP